MSSRSGGLAQASRIARLVLAPALAATAPAQELIWERTGTADESWISYPITMLGDVDGDGFDELLQTAEVYKDPLPYRIVENQLWVLSGRDGRTLSTAGFTRARWNLLIAAAGDMDGDGGADYAVSLIDIDNEPPWDDTRIEVRSGRDHRMIWSVVAPTRGSPFGDRLLGNLDLDGDGRPNLVIHERNWPGTSPYLGAIYAYDHDGRLLYRVTGTPELALRHNASALGMGIVGDVDGDGHPDYVTGGVDQFAGVGAAIVLSGIDGRVLRVGRSVLPYDVIGDSADGVGDMDGDGVPDFAGSSISGFGAVGSVQVFSGRTAQLLRMWSGNNIGSALRSGGLDFDRDGVPDVLSPYNGHPQPVATLGVLSGRDGSPIHEVMKCQTQECGDSTGFGHRIAVGRAHPGSPFPVFAMSHANWGPYAARWGSNWQRGKVSMYRGTPAGAAVYGPACTGTLANAPRIGIKRLGVSPPIGVRLHLTRAEPGNSAVLLLGLSRTQWLGLPLPLPLDALGFPGCSLHTSVEVFASVTVGQVGLDRGYGFADLNLPLALPGRERFALHGQWLALGSGPTAPGALSEPMLWLH
jgi:hypothetical protein